MRVRKIRILIVDQNALVRDGLRMLVHLQPDMELACMAASGPEAVERFVEVRPDVTVIDLELPCGSGVAAVRDILTIDAAACVIGAYTYERDKACEQAMNAGAQACITKDRLNEDLIPLVRDCVTRT